MVLYSVPSTPPESVSSDAKQIIVMAEQVTYQAVESFLIGRACKPQAHGHTAAGNDVDVGLAKRNKVIEKQILATEKNLNCSHYRQNGDSAQFVKHTRQIGHLKALSKSKWYANPMQLAASVSVNDHL